MKRPLLAFFGYTVATFTVAILWNLVLFRDLYLAIGASAMRGAPIVPLGFAAVLTQALAITVFFELVHQNGMTIARALILSFCAGGMSIAYAAFTVPAKFTIAPISTYTLLELAFGAIQYLVVGLVLFAIYRRANVGQAASEKPAV